MGNFNTFNPTSADDKLKDAASKQRSEEKESELIAQDIMEEDKNKKEVENPDNTSDVKKSLQESEDMIDLLEKNRKIAIEKGESIEGIDENLQITRSLNEEYREALANKENEPDEKREIPEKMKETSRTEEKNIEVITSVGAGGRKISEETINKTKQFIDAQNEIKNIKIKRDNKELISTKEAALLREDKLFNSKIEKEVLDKNEKPVVEKTAEVLMETKATEISLDKNNEEEKSSTEILKGDADKLFLEALAEKKEVQRLKDEMGKVSKAANILGIGKNSQDENNPVRKFREAEKKFEKKQEAYRAKFQDFADQTIAEKKIGLGAENIFREDLSGKISELVLTEKLVDGFSKNEKGENTKEQFTLFEYMNQNEKKLIEKRKGELSEKEEGLFGLAWERYKKLPKIQKFAWSVALSASVGAGATLLAGGGIAMAAGCFGAKALSDKVSSKLLRMAGIGSLVGGTIGALKYDTMQLKEKNKDQAQKKMAETLEKVEGSIFTALDKYNKQLKNKERTNKLLIGATAVSSSVLLGGVDLEDIEAGLESLNDNVTEEVEGIDTIIPGDTSGEIPDNSKKPEFSVIPDETSKDPVNGQDALEEMKGTTKDHIDGVDKKEVFEAGLLNGSFELKPNGNVWNSLSDHFNGDKQAVGQALAGFREETLENLTESGMSDAQANEFIEWRYRHMNVGTDFQLENGELKIPDFTNEKMLERFEAQNPSVEVVENTRPAEDIKVDQEIYDHAEGRERAGERLGINNDYDDVESLNSPENDLKVTEGETVDLNIVDEEIDKEIDQVVEKKLAGIYENWGKDQTYEWNVMQEKNAWDIIDGKYGDPIGIDGQEIKASELPEAERGTPVNSGLDQAEINNREQLKDYLLTLRKETGLVPEANEKVEEFIRRAERSKL